MKREIYGVYAEVVDATGARSTVSGYPKWFDSHQNSDNCELAKRKAYGEYHTILGQMYNNQAGRQSQAAWIIRANDWLQIEKISIGNIADLPDPTYAVTVNNGTGGGSFIEGAEVAIQGNEPAEGMQFVGWEGAEGLTFSSGSASELSAVFIMPGQAVTLTATYEAAE